MRFSRVLLTVFLACLMLSSCVSQTKRNAEPFALPSSFSETGEAPLESQWWEQFSDPGLNEVVQQALSNNFSLLATRDKLRQAQAVAEKAGADLYPGLDGSGMVKENWVGEDGGSSSTSTWRLGLAASYEVDLWGRVRAGRDAALFDAEASLADLQAAAISLAARITEVWFQLADTGNQIKLVQDQEKVNRKILQVITAQFRTGKAAYADVLQQKQLIESKVGELITLEAQLGIMKQQLAVLAGRLPTDRALPYPEVLVELPPLPETGIPFEVVSGRPDVQSRYYALLSADSKVAEAVANQFPRLSITADASTGGGSASDLFNNWLASLAGNLTGPILDGGYRKAEVKRTRAYASEKLNLYGQTILEALDEIESALIQEREQTKLTENIDLRLTLSKEAMDRIGERYKRGAEDYQRVLTALISYQGLQRDSLKARRQVLEYRLGLYRAMGGSFLLSEPQFGDE